MLDVIKLILLVTLQCLKMCDNERIPPQSGSSIRQLAGISNIKNSSDFYLSAPIVKFTLFRGAHVNFTLINVLNIVSDRQNSSRGF